MATKSRLISKLISGTGQIKAAVLDSDAIGVSTQKSLSTVSGTATYSSADTLPTTATDGDQALVTSTNRLYIYSGSGWYNIALVNNTPYWSTEAGNTYTLAKDSTPTVVTILAVDSDGTHPSYSATTDSNFDAIATISKDSDNGRVFTIVPIDSDGGSQTAGSGTVTFKASDGINLVSTVSTFSISFSVANSKYTTLLIQADDASTDNQVDASSNTHTITESGSVTSTAFTPYHPGGYSYYFDGTGDYLSVAHSADHTFGNGQFTIECWVYMTAYESSGFNTFLMKTNGTNQDYQLDYKNGSTELRFIPYVSNSAETSAAVATATLALRTWHHIAVTRDGSNDLRLFHNGSLLKTTSYSSTIDATASAPLIVGARNSGGSYDRELVGYVKDLRIVKGSAVYTSAFSVPTSPLTAIANTKLLLGNLPYNEDASTGSHTITPSISGVGPGSTMMARFSPYDYGTAYTKADHGGSLDFQAANAYIAVDSGAITSSWGNNFTVEFWLHRDTLYDGTIFDNRIGAQYPGFFINVQSNGVAVYAQGWLQTSIGAGNSGGDYLGKWAHYALTFSGTEGKSFVNGKLSHTYTIPDTATYSYNRAQNTIGAKQYTTRGDESLGQYKARLADFRITKSLVYTSNFTPPTSPLTSDSNTLLLTCTNKNELWEAAGTGKNIVRISSGPTVSNTQRKWTDLSAIHFNGSSGNYLYQDLGEAIGTRDFTIEAWAYPTANVGQYVVQISNQSGTGITPITGTTNQVGFGSQSGFYRHLSGGYVHTSTALVLNTWHHLALVRTGGNSKLYLNGTEISTKADTVNYTARYVAYGCGHASNYVWSGYTQDLRITLDYARYTSNFTPPTATFAG